MSTGIPPVTPLTPAEYETAFNTAFNDAIITSMINSSLLNRICLDTVVKQVVNS